MPMETLGWRKVASRVPLESILGTVLCTVFIAHLGTRSRSGPRNLLVLQSWEALLIQRRIRISYRKSWMTLRIGVIELGYNLIGQSTGPALGH